ncbi:MAG: helix-turn-helix transcriptional regulator [Opitutaceae bacterium]|nr:helix-turn-helix transcriptional regulator [Opitutaceae bacterium]
MTFINQTEVHLARSSPGTTSRWTWINLDPFALVAPKAEDAPLLDPTPLAGPGFDNLFTPGRVPAVGRVALRLIEEIHGAAPGRALAVRSLVCELMTLAHRQTNGLASAPSRPDYERLAPALSWIARNYAEPTDIGALARRCGLSEPHFRRLFLRTLGRTPLNYWHDLRLSMAASLLRGTTHSILEIGQLVGFESPSSLNRQFRARYGKSPRAWRGDSS